MVHIWMHLKFGMNLKRKEHIHLWNRGKHICYIHGTYVFMITYGVYMAHIWIISEIYMWFIGNICVRYLCSIYISYIIYNYGTYMEYIWSIYEIYMKHIWNVFQGKVLENEYFWIFCLENDLRRFMDIKMRIFAFMMNTFVRTYAFSCERWIERVHLIREREFSEALCWSARSMRKNFVKTQENQVDVFLLVLPLQVLQFQVKDFLSFEQRKNKGSKYLSDNSNFKGWTESLFWLYFCTYIYSVSGAIRRSKFGCLPTSKAKFVLWSEASGGGPRPQRRMAGVVLKSMELEAESEWMNVSHEHYRATRRSK